MNPDLEALEREFNHPASTMHVDVFNARYDEILARPPKPTPPKPKPASEDEEVVTRAMFLRLGRNAALAMSDQISKAIAPLSERVAALEAAVAKIQDRGSAAPTIVCDDVNLPGLAQLAGAIERLEEIMRKPVVPVYNAAGVLVGAKRVEKLDEDT